MTKAEVSRYFRALAREISEPATILLFGGGAAIVQTRARATGDLDMEVQSPVGRRTSAGHVQRVLDAIRRAEASTGISVQAGERVQRWSMIHWGEYRAHQRRWRRFGSIDVELLEPEYFAVTKLSRASAVDVQDIIQVFKAQGGSWERLAKACGEALRASPLSTAQDAFRRQVEHFFNMAGPRIWGAHYQADRAVTLFQRSYRRR